MKAVVGERGPEVILPRPGGRCRMRMVVVATALVAGPLTYLFVSNGALSPAQGYVCGVLQGACFWHSVTRRSRHR